METAVLADSTRRNAFKANLTAQFIAKNAAFSLSQITVQLSFNAGAGVSTFVADQHPQVRRALTTSAVTVSIIVANPTPSQQSSLAQEESTSFFQAILANALPALGLTPTQIAIIKQTITVTVQGISTVRATGISTLRATSRPTIVPAASTVTKGSHASATYSSSCAMIISTLGFIWMAVGR